MARYRPVSGRLAGLRGRITDEDDGVVLVMVAMSLGVVLALMSMVIVLGSIYVAQRQAQGAADAAALGAAQDLNGAGDSTQDTSASSDGTTVAEQNDPNSTVQVTAPYNGDATTVQVVVTKTVGLPFGFRTNVSATADARNNVVNNGSFDANFSASWIEYCAANGVTSAGHADA
jgi:uncharacterized membrane protein